MSTNVQISQEESRVDEAAEPAQPVARANRGADCPLPKPPPLPQLATVDGEARETGRAAPLQSPAARHDGERWWSDTGASLLPVVASAEELSDRSADEQGAPSRSKLWPPSRRLAAVAAIAAGTVAAVVWVVGAGGEQPTQLGDPLGNSPAAQDAPARVEAVATPRPPAAQATPAEPPPTDDVDGTHDIDARKADGAGTPAGSRGQAPAEASNEPGQPVASKSAAEESTSTDEGHADAAEATEPSSLDDEGTDDALKPFDQAAARSALNAAAIAASGCNRDDLVDPSPASVSVTWVPIGRAKTAVVSGGPYAGTATGSCIVGAFRGLSVPAFAGGPITAQTTVTLR